jgi:aminoglycoside 6'-N-acetyltransferase I
MELRAVMPADRSAWLRLRRELWPDCPAVQHALDIDAIGRSPSENLILVIDRGDGRLGGFAEVSIHAGLDGLANERVAYLEGWYVEHDLREQGWGRRLVEAAEVWAAKQGLAKLGSDAPFDNEAAIAAHKKIGFRETGRLVHFLKPVGVRAAEPALFGD